MDIQQFETIAKQAAEIVAGQHGYQMAVNAVTNKDGKTITISCAMTTSRAGGREELRTATYETKVLELPEQALQNLLTTRFIGWANTFLDTP
jgi:hypothetical protein